MFDFFNNKNFKYLEVPEWANTLNLKDFNNFISIIEKNFQNKIVNLDISKGTFEVPEVFGTNYQLGIVNLASICCQFNKRRWKKIIKEHFENLHEANKFEKELKKIIHDFTCVSKYIALRVWPKSYIEDTVNDKAIYKEDIEGLVSTLVFDTPTTVRSISIDEIKNWNVPVEQLFEIGMKNVINKYPVKVISQNIDEKPCYVFSGEHFFVASYAFILSRYKECLGKYGTIVSFPNRHFLIAYPINGEDIIVSINTLLVIAKGMFEKGPGPISSNVYWFRDDKFFKLPYEITDDAFHFYPPEEYIKMLESIIEDKNKVGENSLS